MLTLLEWLVDTFGAFLIPPVLFGFGVLGYSFLVLFDRWR